MDIDSPSSSDPVKSTAALTPADRISELNQIDLLVSQLLSSASTATSILANQSSTTSTSNLSSAKEDFASAAQSYFSTLSSIEVRLRRQVYALEEAGLIAPGDERDTRRGRTLNNEADSLSNRGRGSGGGVLDPSWLNARVSDAVEAGKKREVLAQAKVLMEQTRAGEGNENGDTDMGSEEG